MSDFKAKMHHIRFSLGLRLRPRWGNLQRSPDLLAVLFKGPTSKGRDGEGWDAEEGRGGKEKRRVRKRKRGESWPPSWALFVESGTASVNTTPTATKYPSRQRGHHCVESQGLHSLQPASARLFATIQYNTI